jgi:hypothetical protein
LIRLAEKKGWFAKKLETEKDRKRELGIVEF